MPISTQSVIRILELVAPLRWGRFGTGSTDAGPSAPLIVWRYDEEPGWFRDELLEHVANFDGLCQWVVEKTGRNWVLWPTRQKAEFEAGTWSGDAAYMSWLAEEDPDFCDRASADLASLFESIEARLLVVIETNSEPPDEAPATCA